MSIVVDRFSSATNKNLLYKKILGFKMLSQVKVNRMCVVQPQLRKESFFSFLGFCLQGSSEKKNSNYCP